ncbi:hypothetical protein NC653_007697 [Populus alba x Populus x berolinensis]|uniref:Uncharacterized protein n=1 Tax=Populus alba x Populus x berolinensis TaxID=444605 RepID=A0AAD6RHI2_9ROSI|nr:hypothetical protein NC653_007697 [Populus alba x Populus x berolinensis]
MSTSFATVDRIRSQTKFLQWKSNTFDTSPTTPSQKIRLLPSLRYLRNCTLYSPSSFNTGGKGGPQMATAASPMASQLKSSFASSLARRLVIPTAISGAPFRVSPGKRSFTVKAIQSEKANIPGDTTNQWRSLHWKP